MHHCGPSTTEVYPLLLLHSLNVHMTPWGDLDCGLRFGIVLVLGIGIAQQFLSSIVLGIGLVCRPWYSPSLGVLDGPMAQPHALLPSGFILHREP